MFSARHPMYEQFRSLKSGIYIIEGIIGAGKTTLGNSIEYYLNNIGIECKFYKEYVNNELLNQFISNMPRYAYSYQMIMLIKRLEIYKKAEEFSRLGGVSIIDRSLVGDMTFAKMHYEKNNITDGEWEIYNNFVKNEKVLSPTACIYLNCNVDTSKSRINNRGIISEINGYDNNYLEELKRAYDDVIANLLNVNVNVIRLDWDSPIILKDKLIIDHQLVKIIKLLL